MRRDRPRVRGRARGRGRRKRGRRPPPLSDRANPRQARPARRRTAARSRVRPSRPSMASPPLSWRSRSADSRLGRPEALARGAVSVLGGRLQPGDGAAGDLGGGDQLGDGRLEHLLVRLEALEAAVEDHAIADREQEQDRHQALDHQPETVLTGPPFVWSSRPPSRTSRRWCAVCARAWTPAPRPGRRPGPCGPRSA